jgi:CubicO group peptidase (beta-lactamase class C family)
MTKAVTTVGILQLLERGNLRLDDPIYYYLPAFKESVVLQDFNEADSSYTTVPTERPITIRHLLTHTSGITYGSFNPGKIMAIYTKFDANNFGLSHRMSTAEMVDQIAKIPLVFQPGEQYMYGLNMEVLGRIIEVVSGEPLDQYFQKNIFDPLGMSDTKFYLPKEKHDRLVPIYTYNENREMITAKAGDSGFDPDYPKAFGHNHFAGGGGLSGSTKDYAIFIQTLLNNGEYDGKRIISRKSIEVMTSDQLITQNKEGKGHSTTPGITFGLGFKLITEEGSAVSHKSPGTFEWGGFFNTKFFIDPKEELIFVGMTQIVPYTRPDFWDKMYAIIYGAIDD